nr:histidine kinase3 [Tanacetum cinerariifolium]
PRGRAGRLRGYAAQKLGRAANHSERHSGLVENPGRQAAPARSTAGAARAARAAALAIRVPRQPEKPALYGTVSVVVSSVATDGDFHTLRFAVQDSGIGISPDDAVRLFTSFTQLDTTPSKAFGGTGLGLAISKELAELLGGEIGVFSGV